MLVKKSNRIRMTEQEMRMGDACGTSFHYMGPSFQSHFHKIFHFPSFLDIAIARDKLEGGNLS